MNFFAQSEPGLGPGFAGLVATGFVLVALVVATWLVRRGAITFPLRRNKQLGFTVETALSLGERRSLAVVSVEGRRLLLGLTPANISLITELPRSDVAFGTALDRHVTAGDRA